MTTRTFKYSGLAFGAQTANITASINGSVVFQGPVTTVNEPFPTFPDPEYTVTSNLFSWTTTVDFSGPQLLEITNDANATLLVAELSANYTSVTTTNPDTGNVDVTSSGPDGYVGLLTSQFGNTFINGVLQTVSHTSETSGQWWWQIAPSGTFTENFTVTPGLE